MLAVKIGILCVLLILIPLGIGCGITAFMEKYKKNIAFSLIAGYLTAFGIFQVMAVPAIMKRMSFRFFAVAYETVLVVLSLTGFILWMRNLRKKALSPVKDTAMKRSEKIGWMIAILGILFQLIMNFILSFEDGDDAYYVTNATIAIAYDNMYLRVPYSYGVAILDYRHCLAPFPIFIATIAKFSRIHPAIIAHSVMPLVMICLTYMVFALIGARLFEKKKEYRPLFLIFAEILVLWGNYSVYTAETFLISRSRQGKAMLSSFVIPAIFLFCHMIGEKLLAEKKTGKAVWFLLWMAVLTAALGSTMGNFIVVLQLGIFGICLLMTTRKWKNVLPVLGGMLPAFVYMCLYVFLR